VKKIIFLLIVFFNLSRLSAQRVGVVLSGGGASGVAHVGVLKALEENNIPIDYIAGTSMGALVGGMYAMGYSPIEIEAILTSADFQKWVFGKQDDRYVYYFRERAENSSWIGLKFKIDSTFQTKIPTNIISPINLDFAFMERTSAVSAAANYNFDSLFVPYRAVAADIHNKKEVVFNKGDLGQAMRASTTYPFFFKPIVVDDKLLFDGGLYNNFPADVMYRDFLPDIIIGSTVASEMAPPEEDDIFSQIKNMLMERTLYNEV
jgi:NTE family protein